MCKMKYGGYEWAMSKVRDHFKGECFQSQVIPHYSDSDKSIIIARSVGPEECFWADREGASFYSCGYSNSVDEG